MNAQELFELLEAIKEEYGTLDDIPVHVFLYDEGARHQVESLDVLVENEKQHSIDLNIWV